MAWRGKSKLTTSLFVTKMDSELDIAEEENTMAADIDWALPVLDVGLGRWKANKEEGKKKTAEYIFFHG